MAPAVEELGWLGEELTHRGHHRGRLNLGHIFDPVASEKESSGRVMESDGERTKVGFLGEASYSKAFSQLPPPTRKSPSPLAWHLRPYKIWPLLPSLLPNILHTPANPNSFCPLNMPHLLTPAHFYMLFPLLVTAWAITLHPSRSSSHVSCPIVSGASLCQHCSHGRALSFHSCLPHPTGHSLKRGLVGLLPGPLVTSPGGPKQAPWSPC